MPVRILLGILVLITLGCRRTETRPGVGQVNSSRAALQEPQQHQLAIPQKLSPAEAAGLAARLANEECARLYRQRPFKAEQQPAVLTTNRYRWGGLDVGGPGGFSALVTFDADGSHPQVEVYLSRDFDFPRALPLPRR